jgi:hypothetical protein
MSMSLTLGKSMSKKVMASVASLVAMVTPSFAALGEFAKTVSGSEEVQGDQGVMDAAGRIIYYIEVGGLIMGLLAFLAGGYMMTTNKAESAKFAFIGGVIMLMASGIVMSFANN